jgi:CrcB protein
MNFLEMNWFLAVGIVVAGGLGAVLRSYLASMTGKLPWGILVANIMGSFLAGYASNLTVQHSGFLFQNATETAVLAAISAIASVGLAGGLSTFSSFAAGTVELFRSGKVTLGLANIALNFALPPIALLLGASMALSLLK